MTLGDRIKSLRKDNKMTQEDLGKLLGINRAAVNKYEKGTVTNIPQDTLLRLCDIFEVTPNYLLLGKDVCAENLSWNSIKVLVGEDGIKCLQLLSEMSPDGRARSVQYLEDMIKIYPQGSNEPETFGQIKKEKFSYSNNQAVETLPLSNRAINILLRNGLSKYSELYEFYKEHSFYELIGAGKGIVSELERFVAHSTSTAKFESASDVLVEHAFSETHFRALCTYCRKYAITDIRDLTPPVLLNAWDECHVDLGYLVRAYCRCNILLTGHRNLNQTHFEVNSRSLSASIEFLRVFRRMNGVIDALLNANVAYMEALANLDMSEIRAIIGERAYNENYDVFCFLYQSPETIFEILFPFIEVDSNWMDFWEYCNIGAERVSEKRMITRQRVYQKVEKIRAMLSPILCQIIKSKMNDAGISVVKLSEVSNWFPMELSTNCILELLDKNESLTFASDNSLVYISD